MTQSETAFSNEQLVERIRQGDDSLFALLVERMTPMLRHEVSGIRCNQADGDDLAQEALLALLSAVNHYREDGGASFSTFARACVRNRLFSAARALSFPVTLCDDEQPLDDAGGTNKREDPLLNREKELVLIDKLKNILSALEYRVLMFHLAAYSYEEISIALGVTTKSVDNALQRIRRKLADIL